MELDVRMLDAAWLHWVAHASPQASDIRLASPYGTYFTTTAAWDALGRLPHARIRVDFSDGRRGRLLECNLAKMANMPGLRAVEVRGATWGPFMMEHLRGMAGLQRLVLRGMTLVGHGWGAALQHVGSLASLKELVIEGQLLMSEVRGTRAVAWGSD